MMCFLGVGFGLPRSRLAGAPETPSHSTSVMNVSPRRKQTTEMTRTRTSLAPGLLRWRGNMSVMAVARLSININCEHITSRLDFCDYDSGILYFVWGITDMRVDAQEEDREEEEHSPESWARQQRQGQRKGLEDQSGTYKNKNEIMSHSLELAVNKEAKVILFFCLGLFYSTEAVFRHELWKMSRLSFLSGCRHSLSACR